MLVSMLHWLSLSVILIFSGELFSDQTKFTRSDLKIFERKIIGSFKSFRPDLALSEFFCSRGLDPDPIFPLKGIDIVYISISMSRVNFLIPL